MKRETGKTTLQKPRFHRKILGGMILYCENCSAKNKSSALFCEECGYKLKKVSYTSIAQTGTLALKKPKFKPISLTKKQKNGIGLIVTLAVVIILFMVIGNILTNPDRIVRRYANALYNNNYSAVHSVLDIPNEGFTSRRFFEMAMDSMSSTFSKDNIANFEIVPPNQANNSAPIWRRWFDDDWEPSPQAQIELTRRYTIRYAVRVSGRSGTRAVTLIRQKQNTLLFFPTWRVASSYFVANNLTIIVPAGADVRIQNIVISADYLTSDSNEYTDIYLIPAIFSGNYTLTAFVPYEEMREMEISVFNDNQTIRVH